MIRTSNMLALSKEGSKLLLIREMSRLNMSVIGLSETNLKDSGERRIGDYHFIWSDTKKEGVGLLFKHYICKLIFSFEPISSHLL